MGAVWEERGVVEEGVESAGHDVWVGTEVGDGREVVDGILREGEVVYGPVDRDGGALDCEGSTPFYLLEKPGSTHR